MKPDKDRPSTWVRYRDGLCDHCSGDCCTMPVEVQASDLLRLGLVTEDEIQSSPKKAAKRLIKEKRILSYRESTDLFMLASRPNGDCIYLHPETRRCMVYENRPDVCRKFPSIGPRPNFCPSNKRR